jgi:hypothetical protein
MKNVGFWAAGSLGLVSFNLLCMKFFFRTLITLLSANTLPWLDVILKRFLENLLIF